MGYQKIINLHRPEASSSIMGRKEVYALEKIHGTSAHIAYHRENGIKFFSGGIKPHEKFLSMLDERFGIDKINYKFHSVFKYTYYTTKDCCCFSIYIQFLLFLQIVFQNAAQK